MSVTGAFMATGGLFALWALVSSLVATVKSDSRDRAAARVWYWLASASFAAAGVMVAAAIWSGVES